MRMPSNKTEEAALLGVPGILTIDSQQDDIELKNIQLHCAMARKFSEENPCTEVRVRTDRGDILVAVQGDRSKPAIFTYHDLGIDYTCFQTFFNYVDMRALIENFCVYHINAPGQEEDAPNLPEDYVYPTMEELANQLNYVLGHFGVRSFIGFGVGAGANILARFALVHPQKVDALAVVNCTAGQASWLDWACQKKNSRALRMRGMTRDVINFLVWHHFGRFPEQRAHDPTNVYRNHFTRQINPYNLALFLESYGSRTALAISRDASSLQVPVLNVTGAWSPHQEDTVAFNARLHPHTSTWMKISDCGNVLEEQPAKLAEAFRLFLQGEGYVAPLSPTKMVWFRRASLDAMSLSCRVASQPRPCRVAHVINITENPISEAVVC